MKYMMLCGLLLANGIVASDRKSDSKNLFIYNNPRSAINTGMVPYILTATTAGMMYWMAQATGNDKYKEAITAVWAGATAGCVCKIVGNFIKQ